MTMGMGWMRCAYEILCVVAREQERVYGYSEWVMDNI